MKKRRLFVALLLAAAILCEFLLAGKQGTQRRAMVQLGLWQRPYAQSAESLFRNRSYKVLPGVRYVNVWTCGETLQAEYHMGGGGFGASTYYWGIYTTTDGEPCGWQGAELPLTLIEDGAWFWQEESSDNMYYTCELLPGWYYYRMEF